MESPKTIKDLFSFPGFVANVSMAGVFGDRYARRITLTRRKKRRSVRCAAIDARDGMTKPSSVFVICRLPDTGSSWNLSVGAFIAQGVTACM